MNPARCLSTYILPLLLLASHAQASSGAGSPPYVPGELIVKFRMAPGRGAPGAAAQGVIARAGATSSGNLFPWKAGSLVPGADAAGLDRIYLLRVPIVTDVPRLARLLSADPAVEYAVPNVIVKADVDSVIPNDPLYSAEQHLRQVRAAQAWAISQGDTNIIIGVLDTGTDWDHPDLAANVWRNPGEVPGNGIDDDGNGFIDDVRGWDFVDVVSGLWPGEDGGPQDNNPMDFDGHGTHVSGISSGATGNGTGIASLAWKCKVMPCRIGYHGSDGNGWGTYEAMAQAFVYAADNGASVVNLSFGTGEPIIDAARYAFDHGVVICNSAGNGDRDEASVLGAQSWALSVAAVASNDAKASYSSYSDLVDISAPGGDGAVDGGFLSTLLNPSAFFGNALYGRFQGTSMASPYVGSLAALIKSVHPDWTPQQIMFQIGSTADNIDAVNPAYAGKLGFGRINAYRALSETPPPPPAKLAFTRVAVTDSGSGNNDGRVDVGETGRILVSVENRWGDASGVVMTLAMDTASLAVRNVAEVTNGTWVIGALPGITDLSNSSSSNASAPFTIAVHPQAVPLVIPCILTMTADNIAPVVRRFDLSITPSVLFVDDHGGGGDGTDKAIEGYFSQAFNGTNIGYDLWDRGVRGTPPLAVMQRYAQVVWGCEWAFPSLDAGDRSVVASYLKWGGALFLSGQDIGWDMNEPPGSGSTNEYSISGGASKTWYELYLGAHYIADDANGDALSTHLTGVTGDPIGSGISLDASEPDRGFDNQYPDIMSGVGGGTPVFLYGDGRAGAIRFDGLGRVVYFGFGGLESITDVNTRSMVFDRVTSWLTQRDLAFTRLGDTEDSLSARTVGANISAPLDTIVSVDLYWDTDGGFPFNVVPMTGGVGGLYTCELPALGHSGDVQYCVLVSTTRGTFPVTFRSYHVGQDRVPPQAALEARPQNSLSRTGPFFASVSARDNIAVDTNEVVLLFSADGGPVKSAALHPSGESGLFSGSFSLSSAAASGSTVEYYVRVRDATSGRNETLLPPGAPAVTFSFRIGREIVDDFEKPTLNWDPGTSWGRTTKFKKSGAYSMTDSPDSNMRPNSENTLTLVNPVDLTGYTAASLFFWRQQHFNPKDTAYVEHSTDGSTWTRLKVITGNNLMVPDSVPLAAGAGASAVQVRFRLKTGNHPQLYDGMFLDDVEVRTEAFLTDVREIPGRGVPATFALSQNYPNPFNPSTTIAFDLPRTAVVTLLLYNILGQEVARIIDGRALGAGAHEAVFDAGGLASGVYLYRISAGGWRSARKMVVLR